jgi:hypothetical protein
MPCVASIEDIDQIKNHAAEYSSVLILGHIVVSIAISNAAPSPVNNSQTTLRSF